MGRIAVVLVLWASVARADQQTAQRAFAKGQTQYELQNFGDALDLFRRSYEEYPAPHLLFDIAQSQRQLGQYEAAAKSYRAYLAREPDAPNASEVRARIADMDRAALEKRASAPPTGVSTPPPQLVAAPPPAAPRHWYRNPSGMTLASVGLAGCVTGAVFFGLSGLAYDDARSALTLADQRAANSRAGDYNTGGIIALSVGGAALTVGVIVLAVRR